MENDEKENGEEKFMACDANTDAWQEMEWKEVPLSDNGSVGDRGGSRGFGIRLCRILKQTWTSNKLIVR